jgi:hypothetical protein
MKRKSSRSAKKSAKSVLRLPDLDHAKSAVLNRLGSTDAQRGSEQCRWHSSEPRLAFNRMDFEGPDPAPA